MRNIAALSPSCGIARETGLKIRVTTIRSGQAPWRRFWRQERCITLRGRDSLMMVVAPDTVRREKLRGARPPTPPHRRRHRALSLVPRHHAVRRDRRRPPLQCAEGEKLMAACATASPPCCAIRQLELRSMVERRRFGDLCLTYPARGRRHRRLPGLFVLRRLDARADVIANGQMP